MLPVLGVSALRIIAAAVVLAGQQPSDTVVRVASAPRYPGIAMLVPEVSIGAGTDAAEYSFTRVSEILPMPDGSVIVVDVPLGATGGRGGGAATAIRWYDVNGRYIRALGRSGQGPGEHRNPSGIARLPDGRIVLRDASLHRINVYSPSGESVDTWRIDEKTNSTSSGAERLMVDRAGIIYLRATEEVQQTAGGALVFPLPFNDRLIRLRSDGSVIDTLLPPQLPAVSPPSLVAQTRGSTIRLGVPYSPGSSWVWSPLGYFVTGVNNRYAIDLRIPRPATAGAPRPPKWELGDPVVSIRRNVGPVPVTDAERAAHRSRVEAQMRTRDPAWSWTGPEIPRVKPAYRRMFVASDGRIWVLASLPSERNAPPADARPESEASVPFRQPEVYEVFEPDGTYIGRVRVPDGTRLHAIRGDSAWGITTDADDVPAVTRFRIAWR